MWRGGGGQGGKVSRKIIIGSVMIEKESKIACK